jgi:hypothetical protein
MLMAAVCAASAFSVLDAQAPASALESRLDELLRQGAVDEAVRVFDALADQSHTVDTKALEELATAVLIQATTADDRSASVEACLALIAAGPHPCRNKLSTAADSGRSPVERLRAIAREVRAGTSGAERRIDAVVGSFGPQDWIAAVEASPDLPPEPAVRLLSRALVNGAPDVRFSALVKLAGIDSPAALPVLRSWAKRSDTPGHVIALAAVAGTGDGPALAELETLLPGLEGQDRLAAGVALARQKDARGVGAIREVLNGPDELLQLEAAAALARLGDKAGIEWLGGEVGNTNVWMRLRALEMLRGLGVPPTPAIWRQMADPMPWVRVRAAQLVLEGCRRNGVAAVAKQ